MIFVFVAPVRARNQMTSSRSKTPYLKYLRCVSDCVIARDSITNRDEMIRDASTIVASKCNVEIYSYVVGESHKL